MSKKTKSKLFKSDWLVCSVCQIHIHQRDLQKHLQICSGESSPFVIAVNDDCDENELTLLRCLNNIPQNLQHAFIQNKNFYTRTIIRSINLSRNFHPLSDSIEDKTVTFPLETLKLCKLNQGDLILLITNSGRQAVRTVSLSNTLSPSCIGITNRLAKLLLITPGDWIMCKPYRYTKFQAVEMVLQPIIDSSLYLHPEFISYLQSYEGSNFYTVGCFLYIKYMGKSLEFFVSHIKGEDGKILTREFQKTDNFEGDYLSGEHMINNSDKNEFITYNLSGNCLAKNSYSMDSEEASEDFDALNSFKSPVSNLFHSTPIKPKEEFIMQFQNLNLSDLSFTEAESVCGKVKPFYFISPNTHIVISNSVISRHSKSDNHTFEKIGGITEEINHLRENIRLILEDSNIFKNSSRSVCTLLFGPSGTGKTAIAKSIGHENKCYFISITASEFFKPSYGASETMLNSTFDECIKRAPSILFIDDIHVFFPKTTGNAGNLELRLVHALAANLDRISHIEEPVYVLMATSQKDILPTIVSKVKRIDTEIEIPIPTSKHREEILTKLLSQINHSIPKEEIKIIASKAHGYVGADLHKLCQIAISEAHNRRIDVHRSDEKLKEIAVNLEDFNCAFMCVTPSGLRELTIEIPKVSWSDIGGQEEVRKCLSEVTELPLQHPEIFVQHGVSPPTGILLYGPPGCSKTLIAKALATESGLNFIAVKGPELFSKWVGESEKALREIYRKAKAAAPCIVFFDEIDAFASERESFGNTNQVGYRLVTQLLTEMNGITPLNKVITLAATNRPDRIDAALLRPGRFDYHLYISLPNSSARREIFSIQFRKLKVASNVDVETLVKRTEKYSGAEVVAVCREAADCAIIESSGEPDEVRWEHFQEALAIILPNTPDALIELYENFSSTRNCK